MSKLYASAALVLLTVPWVVLAQPAQPAAKPDSAEAQAAMERAQRMAANPMRVILQAGKFKRKGVEPDAAPEPADPASLRRTAVRNEAAQSNATATATRPQAAGPAAKPQITASAAPVPAVAAELAPAPVPEPPPAKVMASSLLGNTSGAAVPALEAAPTVDAEPITAKAVPPQSIALPVLNTRPTLVSMVEPEIPVRLLTDSARVNEVLADLNLRADGTVATVTLLPPVPRNWQRYIVAALEKWRFEPLAQARVHRVQLVFEER